MLNFTQLSLLTWYPSLAWFFEPCLTLAHGSWAFGAGAVQYSIDTPVTILVAPSLLHPQRHALCCHRTVHSSPSLSKFVSAGFRNSDYKIVQLA